MFSIEEVRQLIENEIKNIVLNRGPRSLYDPISYTLSAGGKRIRPVLALLSYNLFSDSIGVAVKPAIGLEIFHNFTLLHDDIMDRAELRRGKPAVHKKWNENSAILSGDVMQILAYEYLTMAPARHLPEVLRIFSNTAREVCEGQQYDMDFEKRNDVTTEEYLRMIELKTAVLLGASSQIGAIIGGASGEDADRMYTFGLNLGLAFQLQDDLLDTFGDATKTGKSIGGDITGNKKTWLYLTALEKATSEQKKQLLELYKQDAADPAGKTDTVRAIFETLEVPRLAKNLIGSFSGKAINNLKKLPVDTSRKEVLGGLTKFLLGRDY